MGDLLESDEPASPKVAVSSTACRRFKALRSTRFYEL